MKITNGAWEVTERDRKLAHADARQLTLPLASEDKPHESEVKSDPRRERGVETA